MANISGRGGKRPGSGKPFGARSLRPRGTLKDFDATLEGLTPTRVEGDSREVLNKQMHGEVWLCREQIYAAQALLRIEYPPAVTQDGRPIEEIKAAGVREYLEAQAQEDVGKALIRQLDRLRRATPPADIVRDCLQEQFQIRGEPADEPWIAEVCAPIEARFPATHQRGHSAGVAASGISEAWGRVRQ